MKKKILIALSIILLLVAGAVYGAYYYATNNQGVIAQKALEFAGSNLHLVTDDQRLQGELAVFFEMLQKIFVVDSVEKNYLVLLQNNMELRPGGGFLGQYAVITIKDAKVLSWQIFDTNHLDNKITSDIIAPPSFQKWLGIKKMELRDSNWELDFATNAKNAEHLYNLGDDKRQFDGVFAINANMLGDILTLSGPITVRGYEKHGEFTGENVLLKLQDVVEKPFILAEKREACVKREKKTGIKESCNTDPDTGEKIKKVTHADRENRKQILPFLAKEMIQALIGTSEMPWKERFTLAKGNIPELIRVAVENLEDRDFQMWFESGELQNTVAEKNWGTVVDESWDGDYLAVVDANLGALKTDYYIKRTLEYTVDFTGTNAEINDIAAGRMVRYINPTVQSLVLGGAYKTDKPLATMRMSYAHTAEKADYRTSDYHAYTRLYVPEGSQWKVREWFGIPDDEGVAYGNKQVFGYKYDIFIGDTLPTMLQYTLPEKITQENYKLKIQKQSGIESVPTTVKIITAGGDEIAETFDLTRDVIVRLSEDGGAKKITIEKL